MIQTSRSRRSRAVLTLSAMSIVAVGASVTSAEAAGPSGSAPASPHSPAAAVALAAQLGTHSAGAYVDAAGHSVVTVTDSASAAKVRAIGASPKLVKYNTAALAGVTRSLDASARVPGTAWAVDPASDQVVVSIDQTVNGAKLAKVTAAVAKAGDAARLQRVAGTFSKRLAGGDAIYGGQYRCSLGFNVRSGSTYYFLTAGHCGNLASTWYSNSAKTAVLGNTAGSSFPGNDYAIVQYTNGTVPPSTVDLYNGATQDITWAGDAFIGESVKRSGSTTGVHGGTVQATNATVNYAEGTVSGLIQTNVCAEGGDSGGSLFDRTEALGLTSGGSGNCSTGGTTYFQPVTEALSAYGVSIYPPDSTMMAGQSFAPGTNLWSPSRQYAAAFQSDGNLVVWGPNGVSIWNSGTSGRGATELRMQTDGNLVIYAGTTPLWNSETWNSGSHNRLVMQDDGNLVIYTASDTPVWITGARTY